MSETEVRLAGEESACFNSAFSARCCSAATSATWVAGLLYVCAESLSAENSLPEVEFSLMVLCEAGSLIWHLILDDIPGGFCR